MAREEQTGRSTHASQAAPLSAGPTRKSATTGGFVPAIGLKHQPNNLHFVSPAVCYSVLQSTHRVAVGKPATLMIAGVSDVPTAKDVYRKTRAAVVGFYTLVNPQRRRTMFGQLLEFAKQHHSFDGLEGVFLTGLRSQEEEGDEALIQEALQTIKGVGLGSSRDGGGVGSVFFDMGDSTVASMSGNGLAGLASGWTGAGTPGLGSFGVPTSTSQSVNSAATSAGAQGASAANDAVNQARGQVANAAAGFLTSAFGSQTAGMIQELGTTAWQDASAGATAGGLIGTVIPGVGTAAGAIVGGVVGFFFGLFDAAEDLAAKDAEGKAEAAMTAALDEATQSLNEAVAELNQTVISTQNAIDPSNKTDGTPAPAPGGDGTPTPAPGGDGTPTPAPGGDGTPAPAPGDPAPGGKDNTPPAGGGTPTGGDGSSDTPPPPDPPAGGSSMPAGDVGDDDTGGGSAGGHSANDIDVGVTWPKFAGAVGGTSGEGDPGDETLGRGPSFPTLEKAGSGGMQVEENDTGLKEVTIPKGTVFVGRQPGDNSGDDLGKPPMPKLSTLVSQTATIAGAAGARKVSLTKVGATAIQVTAKPS